MLSKETVMLNLTEPHFNALAKAFTSGHINRGQLISRVAGLGVGISVSNSVMASPGSFTSRADA